MNTTNFTTDFKDFASAHNQHVTAKTGWQLATDELRSHGAYFEVAYRVAFTVGDYFTAIGYVFLRFVSWVNDFRFSETRFSGDMTIQGHLDSALKNLLIMWRLKPRFDFDNPDFHGFDKHSKAIEYNTARTSYEQSIGELRTLIQEASQTEAKAIILSIRDQILNVQYIQDLRFCYSNTWVSLPTYLLQGPQRLDPKLLQQPGSVIYRKDNTRQKIEQDLIANQPGMQPVQVHQFSGIFAHAADISNLFGAAYPSLVINEDVQFELEAPALVERLNGLRYDEPVASQHINVDIVDVTPEVYNTHYNDFETLKNVILRQAEHCEYLYKDIKEEGDFESKFRDLARRMQDVASVSEKRRYGLTRDEVIKDNQRAQVRQRLPEVSREFARILIEGSAGEKKQALRVMKEFLENRNGYNSKEVWMLSQNNNPTLAQVMLLNNPELIWYDPESERGVIIGMASYEDVQEALADDALYFVALLEEIIPFGVIQEILVARESGNLGLDAIANLFPQNARSELLTEKEKRLNNIQNKKKKLSAEHSAPEKAPNRKRKLSAEHSASEKAPILSLEYNTVLTKYANSCAPDTDDIQIRREAADQFAAMFKKLSESKKAKHLTNYLRDRMINELGQVYLNRILETEVARQLQSEIRQLYPLDLRGYMRGGEEAFMEASRLNIKEHLIDSEGEENYLNMLGRLSGLHSEALETARENLEPIGLQIPEGWGTGAFPSVDFYNHLANRYREIRAEVNARVRNIVTQYVDRLISSQQASSLFKVAQEKKEEASSSDESGFDVEEMRSYIASTGSNSPDPCEA